MKILLGMPSKDSWGGPISSEPPFAAALREIEGVREVREEVYVYGDKAKPTPFFERVRRVLQTAFRFRRVLRERDGDDFDVIHLNTAFDLKTLLRDTVSIFLMRPPKETKIFLKIHGSEARFLENRNPLVAALRSYLNRRTDGFGVHTREEKANFLRGGFDEKKIYFVKNAVPLAEDFPENFSRRQKAKSETFELFFVSRFIAAKGLIETVRACGILREQGYKFVLHAVGDGETRAEAESEAARLGLEKQVKFTGYIPEAKVTEYFFNSDIFVFPTRHAEGFPNVLFKAVAAGMPIVTTKIRAAADYLSQPENCLFTTQAPEKIAARIIELIESAELRRRMSDNNLAYGATLKPEAIAREFLEIYRELVKR